MAFLLFQNVRVVSVDAYRSAQQACWEADPSLKPCQVRLPKSGYSVAEMRRKKTWQRHQEYKVTPIISQVDLQVGPLGGFIVDTLW